MEKIGSKILVAVCALSILVSQGVGAVSSGGIGGRPAQPDADNPRTQSIFINTVETGQKADDVVRVSNNSDETQTIIIYAVDGVVTNTGSYTCKQASEDRQSVGSWTNISQGEVTLDSGTYVDVPFTIDVPDNADVGEHNGCIVFENKNEEATESNGVMLRTRQAVRSIVLVPGDLKREVTLDSLNLQLLSEKQTAEVSLKNRGNVSADVDVKVNIDNVFGSTVQSVGGQYPILPDDKLDLIFSDKKLYFWGGWYWQWSEITYGEKAGTYGVPENDEEKVSNASEKKLVFIMPALPAILIYGFAILLVAGIFVWKLASKKRKQSNFKKWQHYTVKEDDTLESIAKDRGVGWKKIAKVNNLTAPYTIKNGDELRVPSRKKATK